VRPEIQAITSLLKQALDQELLEALTESGERFIYVVRSAVLAFITSWSDLSELQADGFYIMEVFAWFTVFFEFFQLFQYSSLIQEDMVSTCQLPMKPGATTVLPHPLHGGSILQQCCFLRSVDCASPLWLFSNPLVY